MSKPIWYIHISVTHNKSIIEFDFPTCAKDIKDLNEFDKLYIIRKLFNSKKGIRDNYNDIFSKCIFNEYEIIKQIGQTAK